MPPMFGTRDAADWHQILQVCKCAFLASRVQFKTALTANCVKSE